jgi:hypothetical protein
MNFTAGYYDDFCRRELAKLRSEAQNHANKAQNSYEEAAPDYANTVKAIIKHVEQQYRDLKARSDKEPNNRDLERQVLEIKIAICHWDWKLLNEVKNYVPFSRLGYTEDDYDSINPSIEKLVTEHNLRFPVSDLRRDINAEIRDPIYDKCRDIWTLLIEGTLHEKITWEDHILLCSVAEKHWKNVDNLSDQLIDELLIRLKKTLNKQCFGLNADQSRLQVIRKDEVLAKYLSDVSLSGHANSDTDNIHTIFEQKTPTIELSLAEARIQVQNMMRNLDSKIAMGLKKSSAPIIRQLVESENTKKIKHFIAEAVFFDADDIHPEDKISEDYKITYSERVALLDKLNSYFIKAFSYSDFLTMEKVFDVIVAFDDNQKSNNSPRWGR